MGSSIIHSKIQHLWTISSAVCQSCPEPCSKSPPLLHCYPIQTQVREMPGPGLTKTNHPLNGWPGFSSAHYDQGATSCGIARRWKSGQSLIGRGVRSARGAKAVTDTVPIRSKIWRLSKDVPSAGLGRTRWSTFNFKAPLAFNVPPSSQISRPPHPRIFWPVIRENGSCRWMPSDPSGGQGCKKQPWSTACLRNSDHGQGALGLKYYP